MTEKQNDLTPINNCGEIAMTAVGDRKHPVRLNFWSVYNRFRLLSVGIKVGPGFRAYGPVLLRIEGDPGNISIGKNVTLLPLVDFRLREAGRIRLHDGIFVETCVRFVVANAARLEIGAESQIGMGTIINSGADVRIGRHAAIAAYCSIVASEHSYFDPNAPIKYQGYNHRPICIGQGVWVANSVTVRPGVRIGDGSVIGAGSVVHGDIPAWSIAFGNPAKVVKKRPKSNGIYENFGDVHRSV